MEEKKTQDKTTKKNIRSYIINISILVLVSGLALFFTLKDHPEQVFGYIVKSDWKYLLYACLLMLAALLLEGLILTILAKMYKRNYPFYKGTLNALIGVFFNDITPSSSGGQFVQAYTFTKQGVRGPNAASILFMRFIIFQIVLVLFSLGIFIWKFDEMRAYTATFELWGMNFDIITLSIVGFIVNAFVIVGLFLLAYSKLFYKIIFIHGLNLLGKLKIVKNKDQKILEMNTKIETFRIELTRLLQNWKVLIVLGLLILIKMVIIYTVPYFVTRALGGEFNSTNLFDNLTNTVSMTLFSSTITSMIPLPGASGVSELVFTLMYGQYIVGDASLINAIILVWRGVTYYLGLIAGFIVFITYHESPRKEYIHGNQRTMLQLQIKMIDEEKSLTLVPDDEGQEQIPQEEVESIFSSLKKELSRKLKRNDKIVTENLEEQELHKKEKNKKKDKKEEE